MIVAGQGGLKEGQIIKVLATAGTHALLLRQGVPSERVLKLHEGRPNIVDAIINGQIDLIINTPHGRVSEVDDSYIRKNAVKYRIPYITTPAAALAAAVRDPAIDVYVLYVAGQPGGGRAAGGGKHKGVFAFG